MKTSQGFILFSVICWAAQTEDKRVLRMWSSVWLVAGAVLMFMEPSA